MPSLDNANEIALLSVLIFTSLTGLTVACIALWHIFWKNADELKFVDRITINSTVSCIIFHATTVILDIIGYWLSVNGNDSIGFDLVWDIIWTLSKSNLYFIYIYRLHVTFKDSKYAYPPTKIAIFMLFALSLQVYNMLIFIIKLFMKTEDMTIILAMSSIYLVLNFFLVLFIMFLFLNPIIHLMEDMRSKSEQLMKLSSASPNSIETNGKEEESSSSSEDEHDAMTPHSPTKMGAAYRKVNVTTSQESTSPTNGTTEVELQPNFSNAHTSIDPKLKHVHGRMACPEDEMEDDEEDDGKSSNRLLGFLTKHHKHAAVVWNEKQKQILNTGTRLALLSVIGLSSAFIYQFLWIFSLQYDEVKSVSYTWGVDTCINIICIYLSFQFAHREYNIICDNSCGFHGCCLRFVGNTAKRRVAK